MYKIRVYKNETDDFAHGAEYYLVYDSNEIFDETERPIEKAIEEHKDEIQRCYDPGWYSVGVYSVEDIGCDQTEEEFVEAVDIWKEYE